MFKYIIGLFLLFTSLNAEEIISEVASINGLNSAQTFISKDGSIYAFNGGPIFRSTDKGNTWLKIKQYNFNESFYNIIDLRKPDGTLVFFARVESFDESYLYFSDDSCKTWKKSNLLPSNHVLTNVYTTPSNKFFITLMDTIGDQALYQSMDLGKTLVKVKDSILISNITEMPDSSLVLHYYYKNFIKRHNSSNWIELKYQELSISGSNIIGYDLDSLYLSEDYGQTFKKISNNNYDINSYYRYIFNNGKGDYYSAIVNTTSDTYFDTTAIYKYDKKNDKWNLLNTLIDKVFMSSNLKSGELILRNPIGLLLADSDFKVVKEINNGLDFLPIQTVHPIGDNSYIIGLFTGGLYKTTNSGKSWYRITSIPKLRGDMPFRSTITLKDGTILVASKNSIFRSKDNSETWNLIIDGLRINIGCDFYEDSFGNVFIAAYRSLYMSKDKGLTWKVVKEVEQGQTMQNITEADGLYALTLQDGIEAMTYDFTTIQMLLQGYTVPFIRTTSGNNVYGMGFSNTGDPNLKAFFKANGSTDVSMIDLNFNINNSEEFPFFGINHIGETAYFLTGKKLFSINQSGKIGENINLFINDLTTSLSNTKEKIYFSSISGKVYNIANSTSVSENQSSNELSIYPNPASNFIEVKSSAFTKNDGSIKIINALGELIIDNHSENISNDIIRINVSEFAPGVYFVKTGNNIEKFIKL